MLLPLPDKIAEVYARIFGDSRIQSEAATVKVLNGTHTPNLAGDFAAYLRSQGIPKEKALTDEYVGGALFNNTFILSINRKPVTLGKIAEWLKLPESATKTLADLTPEEQTQLLDAKADIVVVLGADAHVPEVASSGSNQGPSSDTSDTSSTDDSTEPVAPIHTPGQTLEPEPAATEAPTAEPATPTPEATATPVFEPIASPLATPEARRRGR